MLEHNQHIQQKISEKFGEAVYNFEESYNTLHFEADKDINLKILNFLKSEESLQFNFLTDLCGIHYPDNKGKELAVVYNLHNIAKNIRIRFKVYTDITLPEVYTATSIYATANWLERETFDFYGIIFVGHPNLKRIMNVEEMDYFPLRKEYPLEDQSRTDKDDEMFGRQIMQRPMIN
ncbi:MAG: NADH-quinone oxidoreductase subunit C [Chitinophagaceae bacterium]|nr:NADH-quinone oxidoreductase subunit C [Chitinophagaceae bacterium]MCW5904380.1 NADH-quinone oxidoreductase subunit C [Chitinophagaceae bacterium]